ncbi:MAG: AMP-binding protein [Candidatus Binatus sp.]|uniref:AMP-binding protein n=1 Tax=Candidatus Binatus sp. TaxID=2811406 RepID=UPI002718EB26|nr:AMP-binding protein [Candidatus Binatus sp.]MDO8431611.1 AMP-binding protein [Candidatus Binatus sp.]
MAVSRIIERQAARNPDAIALLAPGRKPISYGRLMRHCEAVASALARAGVGRGERVAVVLGNGPEMAACFLSVTMIAACAPLNPGYRANEFEYFLTELAPAALIVEEGVDSPAIAVAEARGIRVIRMRIEADSPAGIFSLDIGDGNFGAPLDVHATAGDEALVLFTSGTTARPKMVPLTQANIEASVENIVESIALTERDRCLNVMPLFHVSGIVGVLLASLASGGGVVCTPGFYAPRFFEWCEEFAPTWYFGVPTMHQSVLARARENPGALSNLKLRFIRSAAAPMSVELHAEMEATLKAPVLQGYGLTEASQQVSVNPLPPKIRKPGSSGLTGRIPVAVMDEVGKLLAPGETGEIVVRGPTVMRGYANNSEANRESFAGEWLRTGDEGRLDADGYLYITGRIKEIVNRGGQKISLREIDEAISVHPDVIEAVAFAVRDPRLGEQVAVAAVLRHSSLLAERDLRNFAAERLADYKVPSRIVFVDRIPRGPTGKLQRSELAAHFGLEREDTESLQAPYVPPQTATEKWLAEVWQSVLGVAQVGIHDHFLALGGDSLLLAQVVSRLRAMGGPQISILTFFERPTVAGLAALIDGGPLLDAASDEQPEADVGDAATEKAPPESIRSASHAHWPIQPHGTRPPLYVVGSFNAFVPLARRLGDDQPILGITLPDELKLRVPYRLEEIAASEVESILKAHREGPFYLAGFSAEGVLAYEVAQQLAAKGYPAELVVMVDSACPTVSDPIVARMARNARIHASHVASGGLSQLRETASGIWRRLRLRLRIHGWRMARPFGLPISRPTPREPMDVILANVIASREYVPKPYAGRVLLFRRTESLVGRHRLPDNGWGRLVRGGFEVVAVEGGHLALLAEPGVAKVASKLADTMGIAAEESATEVEPVIAAG